MMFLKPPYIFDFLVPEQIRKEIELENKLVSHVEKFLLDLGQGFAFVGRQVQQLIDKSTASKINWQLSPGIALANSGKWPHNPEKSRLSCFNEEICRYY